MTKHIIKGRGWYAKFSAKARHCAGCRAGLRPSLYARWLLRRLRFH